jgi:pSer/pThr/pTyr-binding forkhead associated (FHA) protein
VASSPVAAAPAAIDLPDLPDLVPPDPLLVPEPIAPPPLPDPVPIVPPTAPSPVAEEETPVPVPAAAPVAKGGLEPTTQLQQQTARLLHVQTNTAIELPQGISVIHIGKPNDRIPPDIDVSGFPNSEIVSRIHADVRIEVDAFYIEDVGSSNGTYVNNMPLSIGNRHRLRPGDRIALGKGDKVTFLFQLS